MSLMFFNNFKSFNEFTFSAPSNTLRAAEVPLMSRETCNQPIVYNSSITEGMFCAGFLDEHTDACDGDSGGPLACTEGGNIIKYSLLNFLMNHFVFQIQRHYLESFLGVIIVVELTNQVFM